MGVIIIIILPSVIATCFQFDTSEKSNWKQSTVDNLTHIVSVYSVHVERSTRTMYSTLLVIIRDRLTSRQQVACRHTRLGLSMTTLRFTRGTNVWRCARVSSLFLSCVVTCVITASRLLSVMHPSTSALKTSTEISLWFKAILHFHWSKDQTHPKISGQKCDATYRSDLKGSTVF